MSSLPKRSTVASTARSASALECMSAAIGSASDPAVLDGAPAPRPAAPADCPTIVDLRAHGGERLARPQRRCRRSLRRRWRRGRPAGSASAHPFGAESSPPAARLLSPPESHERARPSVLRTDDFRRENWADDDDAHDNGHAARRAHARRRGWRAERGLLPGPLDEARSRHVRRALRARASSRPSDSSPSTSPAIASASTCRRPPPATRSSCASGT